jgi:hypothetical protein
MNKKLILLLSITLLIGGCGSIKLSTNGQSLALNLADTQGKPNDELAKAIRDAKEGKIDIGTTEGLSSVTKYVRTVADSKSVNKLIKKVAWKYVESTSTISVEDAHAKAMKIVDDPKSYSKKELAVWENLTARPLWKWRAYGTSDHTYHLIIYVMASDLK